MVLGLILLHTCTSLALHFSLGRDSGSSCYPWSIFNFMHIAIYRCRCIYKCFSPARINGYGFPRTFLLAIMPLCKIYLKRKPRYKHTLAFCLVRTSRKRCCLTPGTGYTRCFTGRILVKSDLALCAWLHRIY